VLKLEISYRVMKSWRILVFFRGFFQRLYFSMVKYLNFHNSSFCPKIHFNVNGKGQSVTHPMFILFIWASKVWYSSMYQHKNRQLYWYRIRLKTPKERLREPRETIWTWKRILFYFCLWFVCRRIGQNIWRLLAINNQTTIYLRGPRLSCNKQWNKLYMGPRYTWVKIPFISSFLSLKWWPLPWMAILLLRPQNPIFKFLNKP
jgi:hypothetical protein